MPLGAGYGDVLRVRAGTSLPSECSPADGGIASRPGVPPRTQAWWPAGTAWLCLAV
ncbi:unnamed protein product [Lepidochelys kempii]